MRISDWSSDVCSSDLKCWNQSTRSPLCYDLAGAFPRLRRQCRRARCSTSGPVPAPCRKGWTVSVARSEEHTSELQSLMRISYAVFCLKKNKTIAHNLKTSLSSYCITMHNRQHDHN